MNRLSRIALLGAVLSALPLSGCKTAADLIYEPAADDPLDGYRGLSQAGINTEMDWGPKQNLLLNEFTALKAVRAQLDQRVKELQAENQNLSAQLGDEKQALAKEQRARVQAEAETEMLRQRCRDRDARILSLSIDKAKLEQAQLLSRIEALQSAMDGSEVSPLDAAATPAGPR